MEANPFQRRMGNQYLFFSTAAAEAKAGKGKGIPVPQRAQQISEQLQGSIKGIPGISRVEAVKGYLNLYFSTTEYTRRVVDTVLEERTAFGAGPRNGSQVMLEFSHPNTHKAFHVGHLRGTILGNSICRILEYAGYDVVRANYPGDMGLHVIKWLWGYLKYHNGEEPSVDITKWMGDIYAEATHRLEEDPRVRDRSTCSLRTLGST